MTQSRTQTDLKAQYVRDGYCSVESLADAATIAELRAAYDRVLASDFEHNRMLGGITHQVMVPHLVDPVFDENAALDRAREIACELLGVDEVHRVVDMLIFKPAGHPHPTPWHQDASYMQMPTAPTGFVPPQDTVQFWIAIDDADVTNGCWPSSTPSATSTSRQRSRYPWRRVARPCTATAPPTTPRPTPRRTGRGAPTS